ncbi:MAG: DUF370 domain-containing protein [Clostridia bacterium]|nr:DUF370 domain-containing protein [Clostridia bacterium]
MYLHLGEETVIRDKNIIGIFDLEITSQSKITRNFLASEEKKKNVINVSEELPRSFVVCSEKGKNTTYITQISSQTITRRSKNSANYE